MFSIVTAGKIPVTKISHSADEIHVSVPLISPLTFTGVSTYSNDFQTILSRAVQIAQIPVVSLQHKDSDLLQRKTLLTSLNSAVSGLAASLTSLGTIAAGKALGGSSSNANVVSVTNTGATSPSTYTIDSITSIASAASERTRGSFADSASTPVSSGGEMTLDTGSGSHTFALTSNTLVGLRDQINSLGLGVTASILTTPGGNYLSVSANTTGATTLKLFDGPDDSGTNLLTNSNQGTDAVFQLNGIDIHQAGNVVNSVIPGVTFTIKDASTSPVTINLASDRTQLSSALQDFVSKYNALRTQVKAQVGPAAGLLAGDPVITQLQDTLRRLTSHRAASGTIQSLAELGVELSNTGEASFHPEAFNALDDARLADGFSFIGSPTSGFGSFAAGFNAFSDPINGIIKLEQSGMDRQDAHIQNQIAALNDRIATMQASLATRLHAVDALQATLESQQKSVSATVQALNLTLYGKNRDV
jgi:flagellar hook-associated protein 2